MWTIRREQVGALARGRQQAFRDRLAQMIARHWPRRCAALGAEELRRRVREGVRRAAWYDLLTQADVARYLNLVMALGPDFDRDPRYPWARALLEDEAIAPRHKLDRLAELTARELSATEAAEGDRGR